MGQTESTPSATSSNSDHTNDASAFRRAWRDGVPFTLLHDEAFVSEKYQEICASRSGHAGDTATGEQDGEGSDMPLISGTNGVPMDELQQVADLARIKLFSKRRKVHALGSSTAQRVRTSSNSESAVPSTLSDPADNDPAASVLAAATADRILSRESAERVASERLRRQRVAIVEHYYAQLATCHQSQDSGIESVTNNTSQAAEKTTDAGMTDEPAESRTLASTASTTSATNLLANWSGPPSSVFAVSSFRVQLEMLREFRMSMPRLFESSMLTIVQTLLDFPPFALQAAELSAADRSLISDAHVFCQCILSAADDGDDELTESHRQATLLLLLAFGVSSGCASLLLDFTQQLVLGPQSAVATAPRLLRGRSFATWVGALLKRLESYRIDVTLGAFEDGTLVKQFPIKLVQQQQQNNSSTATTDKLPCAESIATDGNFVYTWSTSTGLLKIGTGLNFTISGRVYAESSASVFTQSFERQRVFRAALAGSGRDVTETLRAELLKDVSQKDVARAPRHVNDLFETDGLDDIISSFIPRRLFVLYAVDGAESTRILADEDDVALLRDAIVDGRDAQGVNARHTRVLAAFYGDFEVLSDDALDRLRRRLQVASACVHDDDGDVDGDDDDEMLVVSVSLLGELLAGTSKAGDVTDAMEFILFIGTESGVGNDDDDVVCSTFRVGDMISNVDVKSEDAYMSSLVVCGDSLFLSLLCKRSDRISVMNPKPPHRRTPRRLLRISLQDLSVIGAYTLNGGGDEVAPVPCTTSKPLVTFVSEGLCIYEIEMTASFFRVQVFAPSMNANGSLDMIFIQAFTIDIDSVQCTHFVSFFLGFLTHELGATNTLALPTLYTNGKWLAIAVPASSGKSHCAMYDMETLGFVSNKASDNSSSAPAQTKCIESTILGRVACFDARNNLLWVLDSAKASLAYYRNPGLRIPLSHRATPAQILEQVASSVTGRTAFGVEDAVATRVLGFLSENAETNKPEEWTALVGSSLADPGTAMVPFVADLQPTSFTALLALLQHFVAPFRAGTASVTQSYCLQACLSVANASVTLLLRAKRDAQVDAAMQVLRSDLAPLLNALIHSSHGRQGDEPPVTGTAKNGQPTTTSENAKLAVISKALDLYATSIHIFHPNVIKQFEDVLEYLQAWTTGCVSATELKVVSRLLGHLSSRVGDLQRAVLASTTTFETFMRVIAVAVTLQKQRLVAIFAAPNKHGAPHRSLDDNDALLELTLFVNSVSQSVLLSLCDTLRMDRSMQSTLAVFTLFKTLSDGCLEVAGAAAAHVEAAHSSRAQWLRAETTLRRGFFGVVAPMLISSALAFVRNLECVLNKHAPSSIASNDDDPPMVRVLFDFLQANASKMAALLSSVEALGTAVDPNAREQVVESVVVESKLETMESAHEYENDKDEMKELRIAGATRMIVTFDARSRTELNYDYVTFYKDAHKREYYGEQLYSGRDDGYNWPGVGTNPPLVIESDHCFVAFHSDSSNTDWGYKFTARGEMLNKKASVKRHWLVFLAESIVHVLDESVALFVNGSAFAPISEIEFQHDRFLQSDLVKGGLCADQTQNTNVLELLRAFAYPPANSRAEKVVHALMERSGTLRQQRASSSSSFAATSESSANQSTNSAVRAVAAAILHHNMWGMDAYAYAQELRTDVSDQLLRGWKNAQKMRDWFHLGDAADANMQRPASPTRRRSRKLRRQPSAFKGISEEALQILCDNVVARAQFLLELTPASFSYVSSAKQRWGLLAKYGQAIGKMGSTASTLDRWYNLLDELQAATALRSLFQYRRNSSERMRGAQTKSVTEQVLEFIQSDVDVNELRNIIGTRNARARSRAFGIDLFVRTWRGCSSVSNKAALAESFAATMKNMVQAYSSSSGDPTAVVLARVHFATKLSGCDESLRHQVSEAYGKCLSEFASLLSTTALDDKSCTPIIAVLKCCALDFDVEDSYLLHESRLLTHVLRLLSADVVQIRRAAQSLLGVFLARFVVGKTSMHADSSDQPQHGVNDDALEATVFQRQLFAAVGFQLEGVVAQVSAATCGFVDEVDHDSDSRSNVAATPANVSHYLPDESPGLTAPNLEQTRVSWNHSIMLWVYVHSESSVYALKVGDEVRRGPDWKDASDSDGSTDNEVGVVSAIVDPTRIEVRWTDATSEHTFDPKRGVFEVILSDQGVRGTIFVKGNKAMVKDTAFAAPWSSFGLYLNDQRQLSYRIARGSDNDCVYNSNYELEVNEWSHVAVVQDRDTLKLYVNGVKASHHLLDPFLLMHGNVSASESKIVESAHPYADAVDQYWPVHIPGASKIRVTFDPLCDIDQSTGYVRFYKSARCDEYWGDERYSGKYHDPERNFPGAQSGRYRARRNSIVGSSSAASNSIEIPSDRFLVYFHNEGSSNGWGFRLLAVPQYSSFDDPHEPARTELNPYAFYFGEPPYRVTDEPAARCSIFEPKVCNFAVSEDDITVEMQASCPSAEMVPTVLPSDRALHILNLLQTCSETPFGRSLIATSENIGNLLALSLGANVPTVLRCASLGILRDLAEYLSPEVATAQLQRAVPGVSGDLIEYVLGQLSEHLNVWSQYAANASAAKRGEPEHHDETAVLLPLRISAQEVTSLVAAYTSLLRALAGYFDWNELMFAFMSRSIAAALSASEDVECLGQAIASCALLGGTYGGITLGGRVTCCVNIDGKETVETGYVLQSRLKHGVRTAQILFDCDRSRPIDVPVGDISHLGDDELEELAHFYKCMAPFADQFTDLLGDVLTLDVCVDDDCVVYEPKVTRKENVEVLESEHPYCSDEDVTYPLNFAGAKEIVIYFDKQSSTAGPNDYVTFLKRSDVDSSGSKPSHSREYWGDEKYFGDHFPGVGNVLPLRIPAASVDVHFHTDAATALNEPTEWGFKITAHAFEETLLLPPEVPPSVLASAQSDLRARCVKAVSLFFRLHKSAETLPKCTSLVPALTRIANEPATGRPTCSTPRSQVFESKHPYASSVLEYMEVTFRGASKLTVTFDPQSRTELGCDYLSFYKDRSLTERWGASQYSGDDAATANWPGIAGRPPLVIPSDSFTLFWCTDVSNVDWGWKFTVTAEFEPMLPLALSLEQLDMRAYHLFEILYEAPSPQRAPFPQEFDGFVTIEGRDARERHRQRSDPIRQCVRSPHGVAHDGSLSTTRAQEVFAVVDVRGVNVYSDCSKAEVVGRLVSGQRFRAVRVDDGWLQLLPDSAVRGWVWQRSNDSIHAVSIASLTRHENLLVLEVDDLRLETYHSVLEMNESNEEQDALSSFFSQFAFENLKGQCDRFQGFAVDSHRALATKSAREAIVALLSCDAVDGAIRMCDFVDEHEFLVLLSHMFPWDATTGALGVDAAEVLASAVRRLVTDPGNATLMKRVIDRCVQLLRDIAELLPHARGALRVFETDHPYSSTTDQHWEVSIPGATRIVVTCDVKCKCENGSAWLKFYKSGSSQSETHGEAEYSGRGDDENWPGCAGRPPLVIKADSFDAHFHSESSQNDWGVKVFAIGVFEDELKAAASGIAPSVDAKFVMLVLHTCCWLLEVVSETLATSISNELSSGLYTARVVDALAFGLAELPLQVQPRFLQVLASLAQHPARFHGIPSDLVERVHSLVSVKLDVQFKAEQDNVTKSQLLQALVQCAVAIDLAIESGKFRDAVRSEVALAAPAQLTSTVDASVGAGSVAWIAGDASISGQHQFQVLLRDVTVPFSAVVWAKSASAESICAAIEWSYTGDVNVWDTTTNEFVKHARLATPLTSGDAVSMQLDFKHRVLVLRKNGLVASVIRDVPAMHDSSGARWSALSMNTLALSALTVGARSSSAQDSVLGWRVAVSPLALLPPCVTPSWFSKLTDLVATMLAFCNSRASGDLAVRESVHPARADAKRRGARVISETIVFPGAIALEVKLDRRTKFAPTETLRFQSAGDLNDPSKRASVDLVGMNGDDDQLQTPLLFLAGTHKRSDFPRVGDLVMRSRDWDFGDEDGGAGSVGVVQDIVPWKGQTGAGVRVTWRGSEKTNVYRYGFKNRFDVQRCARPDYRDLPRVISGDTLTYSFQTSSNSSSDADAAQDFVGSLRLVTASLHLPVNSVSDGVRALADDMTFELWLHVTKRPRTSIDSDGIVNESLLDLVYLQERDDRAAVLRVCTRDTTGAVSIALCAPSDDSDTTLTHDRKLLWLKNELADSSGIALDEWVHLALVLAGSRLTMYQNGEQVFSARCELSSMNAIDSITVCDPTSAADQETASSIVHVYDVRLWSAALRVEQLQSHAQGLDAMGSSKNDELQMTSLTLPRTPRSGGNNQSLASQQIPPPPPSSPSRSIAVPSDWKQWTTTNRTGKELVTVRLNISIVPLLSTDERIVYYEAYPLSSGKVSIGWMWTHAVLPSREFVLGESEDSFGVESQQRVAHFSGATCELAPFTASMERRNSGASSPRRSSSYFGDSFSNELRCRDGDVIGCALVVKTGELQFFVNGQQVASTGLHDNVSHELLTSGSVDGGAERRSSVSEADETQNEFDQLVDEMCSIGFSRRSSTEAVASSGGQSTAEAVSWLLERDQTAATAFDIDASPRKRSVRSRSSSVQSTDSASRGCGIPAGSGLVPAATLGPQGAQGVVWNFGTCAFKHRPAILATQLQSVIEAAGCPEQQLHFEVFDHSDAKWQRVAYRHKLQDMSPQLLRWWRLDEGEGTSVRESSGSSDDDGEIRCHHSNALASSAADWDHELAPPLAALHRSSETMVSPFQSAESLAGTDAHTQASASRETPASRWGYRFYIIPHYSIETIGHDRLAEQIVRLGDAAPRAQLRHDRHVVRFVNQVAQARHMSVLQLLRTTWSEIAPSAEELVRWPVLVEIATGVEATAKRNHDGDGDVAVSTEASVKGMSHERLAKRFKALQDFNAAVHYVLPFVGFRSPSTGASSVAAESATFQLLCDLVAAQRHRIFHLVKRVVWDDALERTVEASVVLELTLNRPKAMRHRSTGKTDSDARYALFSQAFRQLNSLGGAHYRRADNFYHVSFLGENAQDAGGPYRETLAQYCEELHSAQLPLLLPTSNSQHNVGVGREKWVLHPGATSSTLLQMYEFLGKLLGVVLRSKQYLPLSIASLIWKRLVGEPVTLDDLAAVDSMIVNSMHKMRTIDTFGVTHEMFEDIVLEVFTTLSSDHRVVPLKPHGASIAVTFANRCEYADLVEAYRFHEFDAQAAAVLRGIATVVPTKLLSSFTGAELELMVCGSPEVDVDLLERCTEYSSCSADDVHIVWFWRVLRGFTHAERSAFLRFVWGRSRLPAHEKEFPQLFKLQSFNKAQAGRSVDAYLPVAHTCFFSIELPMYSSERVLRDKVLYAIYNCQEIDGDGDAVAANQLGWEE